MEDVPKESIHQPEENAKALSHATRIQVSFVSNTTNKNAACTAVRNVFQDVSKVQRSLWKKLYSVEYNSRDLESALTSYGSIKR